MREPLYNQRFDDIYFSPEDGLAETRHVFIDGNGLPGRWQGRRRFTIAETGFGSGLNFLAAWILFDETADAGAKLDYISFERYPLAKDDIRRALSGWAEVFGERLEKMLDLYPPRIAGFHRIRIDGRITLTLVVDDVNAALPGLDVPQAVDAWFLDGFAPSKNPEMWTETLFSNMARLSRARATAATFTVAGVVRRGLAQAGFAVEKKQGFGRKKEMTAAVFSGPDIARDSDTPAKKIAVIGGGLAGTSCAYVLGRAGLAVTLLEKENTLAPGASGNALGLYNPRFTAQRCAESEFYVAAYGQALRTFAGMADIGFRPCGALHLANTPEKQKRFRALYESWGWHEDHLRLMDAVQASDAAGIRIEHEALFLPDSGCVSPAALCAAYAAGADIRLNTPVTSLEDMSADFDAVIIACAAAARDFIDLPIHTVRGQITQAKASAGSQKLHCNLCYGGYITAAASGAHMVGSTFQKWLDDTDVKEEDHSENLAKLAESVPALGTGLAVAGGRAALRAASRDHFPVIGTLEDNVYISAAHGSHGILSSLAGAHLLADLIMGTPRSLPRAAIDRLSPSRFTA